MTACACCHEHFLQDLAIGRAAWPIGVTMVGIHARSGRAKIESSKVAHVMNSELQVSSRAGYLFVLTMIV